MSTINFCTVLIKKHFVPSHLNPFASYPDAVPGKSKHANVHTPMQHRARRLHS